MRERQVAFITGASRRIGAVIARYLHAADMNIVLHYHQSHAESASLCEELNTLRPGSCERIAADLSVIAALPELIDKASQVWGRLDVLVNNASRFYPTPFESANEAAWDDLLTSNLKAPFFLSKAAAPYLKKTQGCIINIADIHGGRPMRDYSIYCISKAGLLMLTKSLAKELAPDIRVNAISPGPVIWPEFSNEISDERKQDLIDRTLLKRVATPLDVAKAVLFYSTQADSVTGQVLTIDGGRSLRI